MTKCNKNQERHLKRVILVTCPHHTATSSELSISVGSFLTVKPVYNMLSHLRSELIVRFVDIGKIVDRQCLIFLFIIQTCKLICLIYCDILVTLSGSCTKYQYIVHCPYKHLINSNIYQKVHSSESVSRISI